MSISVRCGACGQSYSLNERYAGVTAKCKQCGGPIAVPARSLAPPAADRSLNEPGERRPAATQAPRPRTVRRPPARLGTPLKPAQKPTAAGWLSWQSAVVALACVAGVIALATGRGGAGGLVTGLTLMSAGIFSIAGAAYGWNWFIDHYKARFVKRLFGDTGTRIFYGILGAVVLTFGVLSATGIIKVDPKRRRFAWMPRIPQQNQNAGAAQVPAAAQTPPGVQAQDAGQAPPIAGVLQPSPQPAVGTPPPSASAPSGGAIVVVKELHRSQASVVFERLGKLSGSNEMQSTGNDQETMFTLNHVSDVRALAGKIDFGKVEEVDEGGRRIVVVADSLKLPEPLGPEVKNPAAPDFYRQNLADLKCLDRRRRKRAVERLRDAPPKELKDEIAAALVEQLKEPEDKAVFFRDKVVEALPVWATADQAVPCLIAALDDDRIANLVIKTLARFRDTRAVEPLLEMVERHGFQVAEALKQIGAPAEPVLLAHIDDSDKKVRLAIVRALGDVGTEKSEPVLKKLAGGNDFRMKSEAEAALRKVRQRRT